MGAFDDLQYKQSTSDPVRAMGIGAQIEQQKQQIDASKADVIEKKTNLESGALKFYFSAKTPAGKKVALENYKNIKQKFGDPISEQMAQYMNAFPDETQKGIDVHDKMVQGLLTEYRTNKDPVVLDKLTKAYKARSELQGEEDTSKINAGIKNLIEYDQKLDYAKVNAGQKLENAKQLQLGAADNKFLQDAMAGGYLWGTPEEYRKADSVNRQMIQSNSSMKREDQVKTKEEIAARGADIKDSQLDLNKQRLTMQADAKDKLNTFRQTNLGVKLTKDVQGTALTQLKSSYESGVRAKALFFDENGKPKDLNNIDKNLLSLELERLVSPTARPATGREALLNSRTGIAEAAKIKTFINGLPDKAVTDEDRTRVYKQLTTLMGEIGSYHDRRLYGVVRGYQQSDKMGALNPSFIKETWKNNALGHLSFGFEFPLQGGDISSNKARITKSKSGNANTLVPVDTTPKPAPKPTPEPLATTEDGMALQAIKKNPANAESIKAKYKQRTGKDLKVPGAK